ncbi:ABC transporter transmembrane domain-containing protein [Allonocardiopsis opalescens]|uniref:ABC transporter family protein n=1 Tax=Allonocardiopsis opalescens TaxID=1144618 RepID=A0A2T0PZ44_9ACTN|nr:ABC transporter transmembrane domain-containing protein [Allonocardiopsis opalescens]PRX96814.1 ABC transporter family protein [Allonocardiopsis opalescens]
MSAAPGTGGALLRRMVRRHWGRVVGGVVLLSGHQVSEALVPVMIGVTIDRAVATGDPLALALCLLGLAVLFTALTMCWRFGARLMYAVQEHEAHRLRMELGGRVLEPGGVRTGRASGELVSIGTSDAERSTQALRGVAELAGGAAALTVAAVALVGLHPLLGIGVLVGAVLLAVLVRRLAPVLTRHSADQQEAAGRTAALATDLVTGVRVLRGIGAQRAAAERYRASSRATLAATLRVATSYGANTGVTTLLGGLFLAAVTAAAGYLALDGQLGIGAFVTVVGLAQYVTEPIDYVGTSARSFATARASADRVAAVLAAPPEVESGTREVPASLAGAPESSSVAAEGGRGAPQDALRSPSARPAADLVHEPAGADAPEAVPNGARDASPAVEPASRQVGAPSDTGSGPTTTAGASNGGRHTPGPLGEVPAARPVPAAPSVPEDAASRPEPVAVRPGAAFGAASARVAGDPDADVMALRQVSAVPEAPDETGAGPDAERADALTGDGLWASDPGSVSGDRDAAVPTGRDGAVTGRMSVGGTGAPGAGGGGPSDGLAPGSGGSGSTSPRVTANDGLSGGGDGGAGAVVAPPGDGEASVATGAAPPHVAAGVAGAGGPAANRVGAAASGRAPGGAERVSAGPAAVELRGLGYRSLDGLDLRVGFGEIAGLVVHDPRDAAALLAVLAGRVRAEERTGAVLLGGVAWEELDLRAARRAVLVEPHATDLFDGTVRGNLLAGRPEAGEDEIGAAVAAASAGDIVADHPLGLDQPVADRGRNLSGGQRQRLALARALLADGPVLVLHDPTTAVDAVTEAAMADGIARTRAGRATLLVTTSPALLARADRVIVVRSGRVAAEGVHAELAADASYRELVLR